MEHFGILLVAEDQCVRVMVDLHHCRHHYLHLHHPEVTVEMAAAGFDLRLQIHWDFDWVIYYLFCQD